MERLRELERAWRESGSLEDHAALLRERWRAGVVEGGVLGLAAHLGHAAARLALGELAPEEADRTHWPEGWSDARSCPFGWLWGPQVDGFSGGAWSRRCFCRVRAAPSASHSLTGVSRWS